MSSIWSSTATPASASPFATQNIGPTPGGGAAAKFQSILQSAGAQGKTPVQPGLSPAAGASSNASASSSAQNASDSDASISANDFLTLLVTEMQNQDPTADVDPNAYIDQLVQINSLEQLISINQNLETVLGAASTGGTSGSAASGQARPVSSNQGIQAGVKDGVRAGVQAASTPLNATGANRATAASQIAAARGSARPATAPGNLGAPGNAAAAGTVGHALDGHIRGVPQGHGIRDIPTRPLP